MGTRGEAVLTSTHNLCFEQKCEKISEFLSENFKFLEVKFSIYLNRRVFFRIGYHRGKSPPFRVDYLSKGSL